MNELKYLQRYYHKDICHFGDCQIYSADRSFCDCGLLYHLKHIDFSLATILFEDYEKEFLQQEYGEKEVTLKEDFKLVELEVFGEIHITTKEEYKQIYDNFKKIIGEFFPNNKNMYSRLEKWYESH